MQADNRLEKLVLDKQVFVVSNRQPYAHEYDSEGRVTVDRPAGGLTASLDPVMQQLGDTWIAWGDGDADEEVSNPDGCVAVPPEDPGYHLKRVWLSEDQVRDYYYGYSNQVLWPVCHSALTNMRCDPGFWERYYQVNKQFADAVVECADDRALVWFQDYHLALAPVLVRPRLPDDAIVMHFWHIPWPAWDTFRACPHHRDLLKGMLGNDLVGFHTERYWTNFLWCVDAALDNARVDWKRGKVSYQSQVTNTVAAPIGVPFDRLQRVATSREALAFESSFDEANDIPDETRIAVGVDRLDYSKGIVERLRALERFFEVHSRWHGDFTFVQNGTESRSQIPAYQAVQDRVADIVNRINRQFGTDDWQPVIYTTDHLSQEEMCGLYRRADMAVVSPVRDGMNLVAQEYITAQVESDGVLVLSDQAGVHDQLGEHAVTVTPCDTQGFAEAIAEALSMSRAERRSRMTRLRRWVSDHDLKAWVSSNLRAARGDRTTDPRSLLTSGAGGASPL